MFRWDELSPMDIESSEVILMSRKSEKFQLYLCALGMIVLILDAKTALLGAAEGIELCMKTVIPSLFPFFVLSGVLTSGLFSITSKFLMPIGRLFCVPKGCESIIVVGLLGGYPLGAKLTAEAYRNHQISRDEGRRMMRFCSNAGPSFIFGMAGALFSRPIIGWFLWGIQILSSLLVAFLTKETMNRSPGIQIRQSSVTFVESMHASLRSMAGICGWIVLFRVWIGFLDKWAFWCLPPQIKAIICGILELSNGCISLAALQNEVLRYIFCAGMLGFGGICITMQTASVTGSLGIRDYVIGKVLQCIFCVLLAILSSPILFYGGSFISKIHLWIIPPICFLSAAFILKNFSGNSIKADV